MDTRPYSYMDLRRPSSTRRYIYEGYGGQKLDKTLILHKSEACANDTIVLRLCKRLSGRISWTSCFKGKLLLASLLALMAIFCYFNLFSSYLPKACHIFAITSRQKLRSLPNETMVVRTRNSFPENLFALDPVLSKEAQVSSFTRKVVYDMQQKNLRTTLLKHSHTFPTFPRLSSTVIKKLAITPLPATKTGKTLPDTNRISDEVLAEVVIDRIADYGSIKKEDMLISRIVKTGKSVNLD